MDLSWVQLSFATHNCQDEKCNATFIALIVSIYVPYRNRASSVYPTLREAVCGTKSSTLRVLYKAVLHVASWYLVEEDFDFKSIIFLEVMVLTLQFY